MWREELGGVLDAGRCVYVCVVCVRVKGWMCKCMAWHSYVHDHSQGIYEVSNLTACQCSKSSKMATSSQEFPTPHWRVTLNNRYQLMEI